MTEELDGIKANGVWAILVPPKGAHILLTSVKLKAVQNDVDVRINSFQHSSGHEGVEVVLQDLLQDVWTIYRISR
ncbi:unnamed protein product [Peronospora belbahrii]|uniref:Uncharacterized protein n=1 Tax=Peronospora belbahrii TaxID=622444 RepID=A0ABN8D4B7_9STRA|nr:unnamed protein product [Peronospora belbahrii]